MSASFVISGMTCDNCLKRVTSALAGVAPDVAVTRVPPRAVFPNAVPLGSVQAALAGVGKYTAVPAEFKPTEPAPVASELVASLPVAASRDRTWLATYRPLLIIAAYIALAAFAGDGVRSAMGWMSNFMAGFFLVFSYFKLLDIAGFADAYAGYDLAAKRWRPWGLIYPFAELALGFAYLFRLAPMATNAATLALMVFSSLGVINALRQKQTIRCACLGTVLNLPMSTVTLVEDGLMAAMALAMLVAG